MIKLKRVFVSATKVLVTFTRSYGYIHVPKKRIPHLLGYGNLWRKCYVIHPQTRVHDCLSKYQWLTKTVVIRGLPEIFESLPTPDTDILDDFEARANESLSFQVRGRPTDTLEKRDLSSGFLQCLLMSVWRRGSTYSHLTHSNLTYSPVVECYWKKSGVNYISILNPLYILHTSAPLELFCEPGFTEGEMWPPVEYHASELRAFERSFDQIEVFGGTKFKSPYSFAHTLFVHNQNHNTLEQTCANALISLFAQSAAHTIQSGYPQDQDLHYPLATYGILLDGKEFTFVAYQLNTLDFRADSSSSRSNVLWIGPTMSLYEEATQGSSLRGFNRECAAHFIKIVLHDLRRKKPAPSESGFALAKRSEKKLLPKRERRRLEKRRRYRIQQLAKISAKSSKEPAVWKFFWCVCNQSYPAVGYWRKQ